MYSLVVLTEATQFTGSLVFFSYSFSPRGTLKELKAFARSEFPAELFHNGHVHAIIAIETNLACCTIEYRSFGKSPDDVSIHIHDEFGLMPNTRKMQYLLKAFDPGIILLYANPDAHIYPPDLALLVKTLACSQNQFFITTQSPFLLGLLLKRTKDVEIYIMRYRDDRSFARRLTNCEREQIYMNGVDIFMNMESYE